MSDIGKGIGDALMFIAAIAALFTPIAIGSGIGFMLHLAGFTTPGVTFAVLGVVVGLLTRDELAARLTAPNTEPAPLSRDPEYQ